MEGEREEERVHQFQHRGNCIFIYILVGLLNWEHCTGLVHSVQGNLLAFPFYTTT